jgi:four helix bundle protein
MRTADAAYRPQSAPLLAQLRRAAISVEANIVEGYALGTAALFRRHLRIALGSAAEVECLLGIGREMQYLPDDAVRRLTTLADETIRRLYGLVRSQHLHTRT